MLRVCKHKGISCMIDENEVKVSCKVIFVTSWCEHSVMNLFTKHNLPTMMGY